MTIVDGIAKGHFLRRVAADKLSEMVLVGRQVKLVWSGCGGGPAFFYSGRAWVRVRYFYVRIKNAAERNSEKFRIA